MAKTTTDTPTGEGSGSRPLSRSKTTTAAPGRAGAGRSGGTASTGRGSGGEGALRRPNAPSLITFFQEARAELRKVTWPTRQEATNLTIAVIVMTVGIAAFLGIIDTSLDYLVKPLIGAK